MSNRLVICMLVALACAFSNAQADMSSATIIPAIKQTVSTRVRSGWRVVESLRLMAPRISVRSEAALSPETGGFSVTLDPDTDYSLRAVPVSSAIFSSISIREKADGQQILDVQFAAARNSSRRCITEVVQGVLFLVCTQLFESEASTRLQSVKVLGVEAPQTAPRIMAIKRKAIVHPMSLDAKADPTAVYLQEVNDTPLRVAPRLPEVKQVEKQVEKQTEYSATVYRKVPALPAKERLLAFAPVAVEGEETMAGKPLQAPFVSVARARIHESPVAVEAPNHFLGVKFASGEDREILLPFSGKLQFTKVKVSQSIYRIYIPGAGVEDKRLLNTFFVPVDYQGFSALEVAMAPQGGLEILVHVERNSKLRVQRSKTGLRLTATV